MRKHATVGRLILALALLGGGFAGRAAAQGSNDDDQIMAGKWSLENARDEVQRGFTACDSIHPWTVQVLPDVITVAWPGHFEIWEFRDLHDVAVTFTDSLFSESVLKISASGHFIANGRKYVGNTYKCGGASNWAQNFRRALLRLKQEYDKTNSAESMAQFKELAARYQGANPAPELPEDARRFRVQAERAVADKRFVEAAEKYGKAIEIAPWWPEAHFNRAVVLAELQSFDSATTEMNRYLLLRPDAPDARQAKDFIYSWEDRPFKQKQ